MVEQATQLIAGHGAKFGRRKEEAIVALLTTRTTEEAARVVNISPKTLLRWQKEPEFDLAFRAAKRAAFGQAIGGRRSGLNGRASLSTRSEHTRAPGADMPSRNFARRLERLEA
jgi:hypothetical protein